MIPLYLPLDKPKLPNQEEESLSICGVCHQEIDKLFTCKQCGQNVCLLHYEFYKELCDNCSN